MGPILMTCKSGAYCSRNYMWHSKASALFLFFLGIHVCFRYVELNDSNVSKRHYAPYRKLVRVCKRVTEQVACLSEIKM